MFDICDVLRRFKSRAENILSGKGIVELVVLGTDLEKQSGANKDQKKKKQDKLEFAKQNTNITSGTLMANVSRSQAPPVVAHQALALPMVPSHNPVPPFIPSDMARSVPPLQHQAPPMIGPQGVGPVQSCSTMVHHQLIELRLSYCRHHKIIRLHPAEPLRNLHFRIQQKQMRFQEKRHLVTTRSMSLLLWMGAVQLVMHQSRRIVKARSAIGGQPPRLVHYIVCQLPRTWGLQCHRVPLRGALGEGIVLESPGSMKCACNFDFYPEEELNVEVPPPKRQRVMLDLSHANGSMQSQGSGVPDFSSAQQQQRDSTTRLDVSLKGPKGAEIGSNFLPYDPTGIDWLGTGNKSPEINFNNDELETQYNGDHQDRDSHDPSSTHGQVEVHEEAPELNDKHGNQQILKAPLVRTANLENGPSPRPFRTEELHDFTSVKITAQHVRSLLEKRKTQSLTDDEHEQLNQLMIDHNFPDLSAPEK